MCVLITVYNCGTQYSTEQFPLTLQTIITVQMTSIGGDGNLSTKSTILPSLTNLHTSELAQNNSLK